MAIAKKKFHGLGLKRIADRKAALPPATVAEPKSKGAGTQLMIMVPPETLKSLRARAASELTTTRALVLEALKKGGYDVPPRDLTDRRRKA
jgi:hypothetical protein